MGGYITLCISVLLSGGGKIIDILFLVQMYYLYGGRITN